MITRQQIKTRVHGVYSRIVKRFGPKYWRSGRRNGQLREPGQTIPFTEADMLDWVLAVIGFNATPCPYCGVPIDALGVSFDHDVPASRGGSLGLDNLSICCLSCNRLKGGLTGEEFKDFLRWLSEQHPSARQDLIGRLKVGAMGARMRYFAKDTAALEATR